MGIFLTMMGELLYEDTAEEIKLIQEEELAKSADVMALSKY